MPKVIQNNYQTLNSNINNNSKSSSNHSSNSSTSSHSVLSSVFARLASILSSFILVLRHGLKKIKEFLDLFPYLRTLFPWRSSTFIKRNRQIRIVAFISCFAFVLLSFTILHPLSSPTQPTEAATGSSQSSSLTLDLASSSASVDLLVTDPEGSFAVSSSNAEFNVTTNNFTGYTLSIMSSNDEGLLTSTNGSSLSSITSAISLDTFAASSSYNGKWGYRPSVYNAAANTSFLPSPTTTATTLDTTTAPNTSTPNYYTIEIGVRSDYTTASSSYTNTFIITAVSNPINYTISYDSHTSDNVTNMPSTQSSSTMATNIVLSSNIPVRDGYDFMGWCTVAPDTATPETCTGTTFQPGGDFGIDQTTLNNTTLYAMWKGQVPTTMQDITLAQCQQFATDAPLTLTDTRDNNTYTVRYIDGRCWMTQNLRLAGGTTLTSADSNVASDYTIPTTPLKDSEGSYTDGQVQKAGNTDYGYWYNFCAASAGTACKDIFEEEFQGSTYDICPAGWRLPIMLELEGLYDLGSLTYNSAFLPVVGGYWYNGSRSNAKINGLWWSSTASDSYSSLYNLDYVYTDNGDGSASDFLYFGTQDRQSGLYIRCVKSVTGTLTIEFDGNGADNGSMISQQIEAVASANLNANNYTKVNYGFSGWNTEADGSGTAYKNEDTFTYINSIDGNTLTLYAQWLKDLTIVFNGNGNTGGSMANQVFTYGNNIFNGNTYTRSGYAFIGWNTKEDGSGTMYYEGETYSYISSIGSDTLILYAQWRQDVGSIQDFTKSQCRSLASDTEVVATDIRDNNTYTVRYIYNQCWMTQNLRLAGGITLTPVDSNVASNYTLPTTPLEGSNPSFTEPQITVSQNTSYGGYYNFCAASAGTNCSSESPNTTTYDICPKGWKLPTMNQQDGLYGTSYVSAFSPVYSGYYNIGSLKDAGSGGYWWSSSSFNGGAFRYHLIYGKEGLDTDWGLFQNNGLSVRCIRSS